MVPGEGVAVDAGWDGGLVANDAEGAVVDEGEVAELVLMVGW